MSIYAVSISLENCDRGHILPHLNVLMIILIARFKRMPFLFSPPWPPASCIICIDGASRRGLQQHQRLQSIMKFVVRHRGNNHPNKICWVPYGPLHISTEKSSQSPNWRWGPSLTVKQKSWTNDERWQTMIRQPNSLIRQPKRLIRQPTLIRRPENMIRQQPQSLMCQCCFNRNMQGAATKALCFWTCFQLVKLHSSRLQGIPPIVVSYGVVLFHGESAQPRHLRWLKPRHRCWPGCPGNWSSCCLVCSRISLR